jgi:hypothetical protein
MKENKTAKAENNVSYELGMASTSAWRHANGGRWRAGVKHQYRQPASRRMEGKKTRISRGKIIASAGGRRRKSMPLSVGDDGQAIARRGHRFLRVGRVRRGIATTSARRTSR